MAIRVKCEPVKSWSSFIQLATTEFEGKWLFRGVLDDWKLKTSLERAVKDWGITLNQVPKIERRLIGEFKRSFPAGVGVEAPAESDYLQWLALMQHYGAPTRLLDWTYSPFVAAYFALETLLGCKDKARMAAIWAISDKKVLARAPRLFPANLERKLY